MKTGRTGLVALAVVAVVAAGVAVVLLGPGPQRSVTAYFRQVVNLYPGDPVKVIGVEVGRVEAVETTSGPVKVTFAVDADAPVPADAGAAIVSPSLVSGRFVQLAPARPTGPQLADGAVIELDRTTVPVEWDQIKDQLHELTAALGPDGANADGAVSRLLDTTADTLDGQGQTLNDTIGSLSRAVGTLSDGRQDLFGTVRNLQTLVSALAQADDQVGRFNGQLASVSDTLATSSGDLGRMLDSLDSSVQRIAAFVRDNRDPLAGDLEMLQRVAANLAYNRQAVADVLQKAPTALSNFQNIYEPFTGSITGALATTNVRDPANLVCGAIFSVGGTPEQCREALGPLADLVAMDYVPVRANPLQRNGGANQIDASEGAPPDPNPTFALPQLDTRPEPPTLADLLAPGGGR